MMNKQAEAMVDALEAIEDALEAIQTAVETIAVNTTPAVTPDTPDSET